MDKVVEAMSQFVDNPLVKLIGSVVIIAILMMFSSFTAQNVMSKNVKDQLADYVAYQNKKVIVEALNETVMPTLNKQGEAIARLEVTTNTLVEDKYDSYVKDINKYYEKYKKGDTEDFTKTNFDAMTGWWMCLPATRKTDALKVKYDALMSYYPNL
jgi:hypothetical protein